MISYQLHPAVLRALLPRESISTVDWVRDNFRLSNDSKIVGRARLDLFPHVVEPLSLFDDDSISIITLQFAAQTAKTVFAQMCLAKHVAVDGRPSAWADADETSTRRVIGRTWRTFAVCDAMADIMPPPWARAEHRMEFRTTIVHGAWPRSSSSAADYGAALVILNETDKMAPASTSKEADFRYLMRDRCKGYTRYKILQISTPSLKGQSFIESERLAGDNRRRLVPCPHCSHWQTLRTGNGTDPGGLKFEKLASGKLSAEKAFDTAWYECEECRGRIEEHHRKAMCNAGKWVPEGCEITKGGKITGTPARAGRHASFGPLSTLHSLLPGVTFSSIAQTFVEAKTAKENRTERIRNYINSWEGETYDDAPVQVTQDDVIDRMAVDEPMRICPEWSRFLTLGSDVGSIGNELFFPWWVSAWGPFGRGQMVDAGICWSEEALIEKMRSMAYPHADGGPPLRLRRSFLDSSSFTGQMYKLTGRIGVDVWPIKGASADTFLEMYKGAIQRADLPSKVVHARLKRKDYDLVLVNTERSQNWIEDRLTGVVKRDDPEWYSIPREAFEGSLPDTDLVHHLTGDHKVGKAWEKRWEDQHFRDALRYSMAAAWHYTTNGSTWNKLAPREIVQPRTAPASVQSSSGSPFVRRSDVPFVASQR
jgi:phage terminase large subunit GpA-like protein